MKSYDELCADATSAAEMRLIDHFKEFGGEVWTIGAGCQSCKKIVDDITTLKKCSSCQAALFCNRECQVKAWKHHKSECFVISTFRSITQRDTSITASMTQMAKILETLSWSATTKHSTSPTIVGVASSLQMSEEELPGWFFNVEFESESKDKQKALYDAALALYGLLMDEECWTRDKDSFPRSSYTLVDSLPHTSVHFKELQNEFVARNGHLLLLSTWLQHPEPPATQSTPLEERSFYGVVDSLLQIGSLRDAVDAFMEAQSSSR